MASTRWRPTLVVKLSAALHAAAMVGAVAAPGWWPAWLAAVVANHAVLGVVGLLPRSSLLGPNLSRLPGHGPVVLTFDDGPDPAVTPEILGMLATAGATASFFCIAERARAHPALVRAMLAAGHRIENHTRTHPLGFAALGLGALRREVAGGQAILQDLGASPCWFRAPMGVRSPLLGPVLARAGLQEVSWTRRGYDTVSRNPDAVLRRLVRGLRGGDIVLLHDGNAARTAAGTPVVLAVLPGLLAALADRGLSAGALPAAIAAPAGGPGIPASAAHACP